MKSRWLTVSIFSLVMMAILTCFFVCKNKKMEDVHSDNLSITESNMEEQFDPIFESWVEIDGKPFGVYTDNDPQNTAPSVPFFSIDDMDQFFQEHPEAATLTGG